MLIMWYYSAHKLICSVAVFETDLKNTDADSMTAWNHQHTVVLNQLPVISTAPS